MAWPPLLEKHLKSLPPKALREKMRLESGGQTHVVAHEDDLVDHAVEGIDYHQFIALNNRADPGYDDPWNCIGHVHPLPMQEGIPGFQRVTMVKWPADQHNTIKKPQYDAATELLRQASLATDIRDLDIEMWAYEGIVLPGGRLMLVS
jgi:hypothetical protein